MNDAPVKYSTDLRSAHGTTVLIAGIGNIFLGDDGFGSEVARRLIARQAERRPNDPDAPPSRELSGEPSGEPLRNLQSLERWPPNVRVIDFGIRGFDLAYALMEDCDVAILVDATPQGGPPGTLYLIEPDAATIDDAPPGESLVDMHAMQPVRVLRLVKALGGQFKRILVLGCEPADFGLPDLGRIGLSEPVAAAIEPAIARIESLVTEILGSNRSLAAS
jgi:hydrogenase maturation protease